MSFASFPHTWVASKLRVLNKFLYPKYYCFSLCSLLSEPLCVLIDLSLYYYHDRASQAVAALLRRLGLQYQGNESYGKIRINGLSLRRWFQPKLTSPFSGKPGDWSSSQSRLGKGIIHQQRDIRTGILSLD